MTNEWIIQAMSSWYPFRNWESHCPLRVACVATISLTVLRTVASPQPIPGIPWFCSTSKDMSWQLAGVQGWAWNGVYDECNNCVDRTDLVEISILQQPLHSYCGVPIVRDRSGAPCLAKACCGSDVHVVDKRCESCLSTVCIRVLRSLVRRGGCLKSSQTSRFR